MLLFLPGGEELERVAKGAKERQEEKGEGWRAHRKGAREGAAAGLASAPGWAGLGLCGCLSSAVLSKVLSVACKMVLLTRNERIHSLAHPPGWGTEALHTRALELTLGPAPNLLSWEFQAVFPQSP